MRLRARELAEVEGNLPPMFPSRPERAGSRAQGAYLAELGEEAGLDAPAALSAALALLESLRIRRDGLFGFNLLLACLPASRSAEGELRAILGEAAGEEQLWLAPGCVRLFSPYCTLEERAGLARLVALAAPRQDGKPAAPAAPFLREPLVARVLEALSSRLNSGEGRDLLFVHGPPGSGKSAVVREAARRLMAPRADFPVLRLSTVFRRRSPLHPFLSGIVPQVLAETPRHLAGPERAAWQECGPLLAYLAGSPPAGLYPDRILADFAIAFGLYARAFLRMARERLCPGLLICEGVEAWHPSARRTAAGLLEDLLAWPDFLPVVCSSQHSVPEELAGFDTRVVHVHPLGRREIRAYAGHLFPGLAVPEAVVRHLRRASGGLAVEVVACLRYLARTGRIRTDGGRSLWVQAGDDEEGLLPASPLAVSWFLVRSLRDEAFLFLYAIHLAGGLVDREGLLAFLQGQGHDQASLERSLGGLLEAGLLLEGGQLIPRFPGLRPKLEQLLGDQGERLRDAFVRHLFSLWEKGAYPQQVLLFSFLARNGCVELALRVLPGIIGRRIDEGDSAGARAFCDPARLDFPAPLAAAQKKRLGFVTTLGMLQAAVLEGDLGECARAMAGLGQEAVQAAEALVACALADLAAGNAAPARERLKKALLAFQEDGDRQGERSAYLALGVTMAGDSRMGEAAEYLGLAERLSVEAGDSLSALRAGSALAGCMFVEGRYSRCLSAIEACLARARALFQRDAELFLLFLQARVLFQLGSYDSCGALLEACLAHAELYSAEAAFPVLWAWRHRAVLYQGAEMRAGGTPEVERGIAGLERLERSRETLLFLAEGLLLAREPGRALQEAERGLAVPADGRFPPPLAVGWKDGSWCVEGRCFRQSRGDAHLRRSLSALRACLLGLTGSTAEAVRELHGLTRGGKPVEEDPTAYMAHYLYSLVLLDAAPDQPDDKSTVLAKALKGLQERASRIDTPSERSAFLTRSYWNRRIMEDARARKLV